MELTKEKLKEFIINNSEKKTVGIGKNQVIVYECKEKIYAYEYFISYDGSKCDFYNAFQTFQNGRIILRYNKTNDVIQYEDITYNHYNSNKITWKSVKFKDSIHYFTSIDDATEYKDVYYNNHLNEAKKICETRIKENKSNIRQSQKAIKIYEKRIAEFEGQINNLNKIIDNE